MEILSELQQADLGLIKWLIIFGIIFFILDKIRGKKDKEEEKENVE